MFAISFQRLALSACTAAFLITNSTAPAIASQDDQVRAVLSKQVDSWNKGDLDAFMSVYYNSPNTSFVSSDAEVWGYDAIKKRYADRYGKKIQAVGKLSFNDVKTFALGQANELVIAHWHLKPEGKPEMGGVYSLVMVRTPAGWRIMHDHTSVQAAKQ